MRERLIGWAAKSLSLAGRITLAKSVLQAIPVYVMQSSWLPKGLCQAMEKLIRSFVWGAKEGKPGVNLVPWTSMQKSIDQGGLGFRDLHKQNRAFLMKIGYSLLTDTNSLWVNVLKTKYKWGEVMPLSIARRSCSRLWLGLCTVWEDLKECVYWDIRNGTTTDFWYDHWLGKEDRLALSCSVGNAPRPVMVSDMVKDNGEWDWARIEQLLPRECLDRIASVVPPCANLGEDIPQWRWELNGQFSTRSAYEFLDRENNHVRDTTWKCVWKLHVPQRVRVFAWLVLHDRLLTNVERVRRHVAVSDGCEICQNGSEDVGHVLRSCVTALGVWRRVIPSDEWGRFCNLPFREWFLGNLFAKLFCAMDEDWSIRFVIICWLLWKRRCSLVLAPDLGVMDDIISKCTRLVVECRQAFSVSPNESRDAILTACWTRPSEGWVKVNVDAAVSMADNAAGIGIVIRDAEGRWVLGISRCIGRCNVLLAELWAIHDGLLHAWILGYRYVELESDCLEAVRISNSLSAAMQESALVLSIKHWLNKSWQVQVKHNGRGVNRVADRMAHIGRISAFTPVQFQVPPADISWIVDEEMAQSEVEHPSTMEARYRPFDPGVLS